MTYQSKVWEMLDEREYDEVWDKFYQSFSFHPSADNSIVPFEFTIPTDIYDISTSPIWGNNKDINEKIRLSLIKCMKEDAYMYALDWKHTGFRYNPRIIDHFEYPVFIKYDKPIKNEHVNWEGFNVYFPTFYPNGDYYFFIAKDFSWGYLTHPWQEKAFVFGDCLRECFAEFADEIGFVISSQ